MIQDLSAGEWSIERMETRIVRYADLKPCYNAFIDTRTPGSEAKENFTIIGPGVSENPEQYVHIAEPHGFNIGGARQPPGCVNSQHSHNTAEVFVVHAGKWRFDLGEHGDDARIFLSPGDVISLPTHLFRGFTNVGEDSGYLWAVLGQDNPGRVTWAPQVFDMARDYGLVLLESGRLIDTMRGETVPAGERPMPPTSATQAAALQRFSSVEAERLAWRETQNLAGEASVIGQDAPFGWPHGFTMSRIVLEAGGTTIEQGRDGVEVVFVHRGVLTLRWGDEALDLGEGDTLTVPRALSHSFASADGAIAFVVRDGDVLPVPIVH